jgi:hypothetical protein
MAWSDWATHPKTEFNRGIRLDANYYYWPDTWVLNRPGMFTGSGMPMRFADTDGTLIDCYQATTQMTDESGIDVGGFCDAVLDKAIGPEGYYGVFTANMHTDTDDHITAEQIIVSALARQVPVISAKQMLTWLDGRNNSSFGSISWNDNVLSFTITASGGSANLRAMLPASSGSTTLIEIKRGTTVIPFVLETIKGIEYAFFDASVTASYTAEYGLIASLPVSLTNLSATALGGKITVRWTTSSEINNLGFDIQRSIDGASWTSLGFIHGAGNSSSSRHYSYVDNNPEPRKYYYRLKQIDIDQHFKYSSIVSASLNGKAGFLLGQNFPNPFNNQATIQFTLPGTEKVKIVLFDMGGRVLRTLVNGTKEAGSHVISLNVGTLSKGVYYYKMQAGDFTDVKKLTIQ